MSSEPRHCRKPIRLRGHDYASDGVYFVTVCTAAGVPELSSIVNGAIQLGAVGALVDQEWQAIPARFPSAHLDHYVIMPDHIHGIVVLASAGPEHAPPTLARPSLFATMRAFKSLSATAANRHCGVVGARFWQPRFFDRIVRDEDELSRIRGYVA